MNQFFKETASDKKIRVATSVTVVILALCAGVLSYDALRNLAVQAGIPSFLAILFPITIDGLILSGSLLMLFFANKGKRSAYGFFLTALGVVSSVAGNVAVSVDTLVSQLVHATSPVVLFLSIEALTILLRWRSKMAQEAAAEAERVAELAIKEEERLAEEVANAEASKSSDVELVITQPKQSQWTAPVEASVTGPAPLPALTSSPVTPVKSPEHQLRQPEPYGAADALSEGLRPTYAAPRDVEKAWEAASPAPSAPKHISSTVPKPAPLKSAPKVKASAPASVGGPTLRERINEILDRNPNATVDHIADQLEGDRKYVRKLTREEMSKRVDAA